jgi:hypothetical protein
LYWWYFSASALPQGASVPVLGLSNKAVYEGQEMPPEERHIKDEYPEFYFTPVDLKGMNTVLLSAISTLLYLKIYLELQNITI